MRICLHAILIALLFPVFSFSQRLTLTPQAGIQTAPTRVLLNNSPYAAPYRTSTAYVGVRLAYQSKQGHGPYLNLALGTSGNTYQLSEHGMLFPNAFKQAMTDVFRVEGGYQWNSKPLYFKRIWDNNLSAEEFAKLAKKGWFVRLQPFAGLALEQRNGNTDDRMAFINNGTVSTYSSNRNLVFSTGLNLEFGKNGKQAFTLGFNYIVGLRGGQTTIIDRTVNGVNYHTHLFNRSSGFNVTLGVPLTIWKKRR